MVDMAWYVIVRKECSIYEHETRRGDKARFHAAKKIRNREVGYSAFNVV